MYNNTAKVRMKLKIDTEAHWNLARNFIPLAGEPIVYAVDDTHERPRVKVGDGVTYVTDLPFITAESENNAYIKTGTTAEWNSQPQFIPDDGMIIVYTDKGQTTKDGQIINGGKIMISNIIYFMKGELPWSHINDSYTILDKKIYTSLDELCKGLPEEFKEFIKYARELQFEQEPDYRYLKDLLIKAGEKNGIDVDKIKYDWEIKNEELENEKDEKIEKENLREENEDENEEKNKNRKNYFEKAKFKENTKDDNQVCVIYNENIWGDETVEDED